MGARTNRTQDPASVAVAARPMRAGEAIARMAFWIAFGLLASAKLWLAANLPLFVDEAFYWQESRRLAWSYTDVPGLTAWLIAAGEGMLGHSALAVRAPFLVLGAMVPLVMVGLVARLADARAGWQAGLWTLAMPMAGTLGVLALPDVPLVFASIVALAALARAARDDRVADWCMLGGALALAWLAHYRAAMLMLAGLAFLVMCARGRRLWSRPGLWIALVLATFGLVPLLAFNLAHDWSALGFQMVERHPWSFHADALRQPFEQAMVVTPFLYALLVSCLFVGLRRAQAGPPWDLMAAVAGTSLLAWFAFGLFADAERFRVHWPLAAYLPLIALLPLVLRERMHGARAGAWRTIAGLAAAGAGLGTLFLLVYLGAAATRGGMASLAGYKAYPSHFSGWREAAATARALLAADADARIVLVADNFMLAAELDFAFAGARPVYTLDSPLNAKHGRAAQLALWQRDETALRALAGRRALVAIDETALRERARQPWLDDLCRRLGPLQGVQRLDLDGGRKRIVFATASIPAHADGNACGVAGQRLPVEAERPPSAADGAP